MESERASASTCIASPTAYPCTSPASPGPTSPRASRATPTATSAPTRCATRCSRRPGSATSGSNFGTSEPAWAGASGVALLTETADRVRRAGYEIGNVAVQVIGNRPRLGPRRDEATAVLAGRRRRTGLAVRDHHRRARPDRPRRGHRRDRDRTGPLMRAAVVVLAAGSGTRVGAEVNKVLLPLGEVPVVARSVSTARAVPGVRRRGAGRARRRAGGRPRGGRAVSRRRATRGGHGHRRPDPARRPSGRRSALLAAEIEAGEIDVVAMHDAARPLATRDLYERVLAAAAEHGGAIPVAPLDHLVDLDGDALPEPLVGVQTPQAFRAADLLAAHRAASRRRVRGHRHRRLPGAPTPTWPWSRSSRTPATSSSPWPTTSWWRRPSLAPVSASSRTRSAGEETRAAAVGASTTSRPARPCAGRPRHGRGPRPASRRAGPRRGRQHERRGQPAQPVAVVGLRHQGDAVALRPRP